MKKFGFASVLVAACVGAGALQALGATPTLTTLVTFNGANGMWPNAGLTANNGTLYGTTSNSVFQLVGAGHTFSSLATFNGTASANPMGALMVDSSGNLFATTMGGGSGNGTVFEVGATNHALSTVASFTGTNGAAPGCRLIADSNGNFFGTTERGGSGNLGTIFEVAALTHTVSTLATFTGSNGEYPMASVLADKHGNLFGTTYAGGTNGAGTVFEFVSGGTAPTVLYNFGGSSGAYPSGGLIADANGNLYGTTRYGGANGYGDIFKLNPNTKALTVLASFNQTNGYEPASDLIMDVKGDLFGTAAFGGNMSLNGGLGDGTVFEWNASTQALSTLVTFNGTNGAYAYGALAADTTGNLYGTTAFGGDVSLNGGKGDGTVFQITNSGFTVPEPTTLGLLALGAAALLTRRARRTHAQA